MMRPVRLLLLFVVASAALAQTPVISRFLARNSKGLQDQDGKSPDWIEIANPGAAPLSLAGWHLTDDEARPDKWTFPDVTLNANQRIVVFASGKDRSAPGASLHTNFKLNADGGSLLLFNPALKQVDSYAGYPRQEANVPFGRDGLGGSPTNESSWRYFVPVAAKETRATPLGAAIRGVTNTPISPTGLTVIARMAPSISNIDSVTLHYRVMFGSEMAVPMLDDGKNGDGTAGDKVFGAVIPASAWRPGQLVRWFVAATADGVASRWPLNAGSLPLPNYLGTAVEQDSRASSLPAYRLFVPDYHPPTSERDETGVDSDEGARGAIYAYGQLYDNVFIRIKGTTSRHLLKRSHRVDFNPGYHFKWDSTHPPLRELNLNAEYVDPSYARQYLSCWLQREAGTGGPPHFPVRLEMNGDFWQLAFHTMAVDDELLGFMGLDPQGALYKQTEQLTPKLRRFNKKTREGEGNSDYIEFAAAIGERQPPELRRAALYDRTDLPAVINYIAVARLTHEADDVWANMVLYRDSNGSGEWRPIPFDLNLSFGQLFYDGDEWNTVVNATNDFNKSHPLYGGSATKTRYPANRYHPNGSYFNQWYNRLYDAVIQSPDTRAMLLRRMRTLMDQYLQPPGTPPSQLRIEAELDSLAARILPDAALDRKKWGWPPVNPYFGPYGLGPNILPSRGIADIKNQYLAPRRVHLYITHSITNSDRAIGIGSADNAGVPLGQPSHASIQFGVMELNASPAAQRQSFFQLINTNSIAIDVSGWRVDGETSHRIKPGTVLPPNGALYLSPDVVSFRGRTASPKAGESRFVQAADSRLFSARTEPLILRDDTGAVIARAKGL